MLTELFLTSLIACTTGTATCSSYQTNDVTYVSVCGVVHEKYKEEFGETEAREFEAEIDGIMYDLTILPFCEGV